MFHSAAAAVAKGQHVNLDVVPAVRELLGPSLLRRAFGNIFQLLALLFAFPTFGFFVIYELRTVPVPGIFLTS
ncbi:hypothetical protein PsorP6_015611 [Peronosclerospora sorghi]|uniref:Uncharacterized protein n=1 Tax=Peronosclerospora sorghi TaxID=230839 RepID=A0ACC0WMN6_9STRA|nr:hypothetical protein PsorP6_015611 [Peronosclerospora sorghi]